MTPGDSEAIVAAWTALDERRALHSADRHVLEATEAARSLVVDLFMAEGHDLLRACARLGALMAERGASPSLAASAIDSAARAFAEAGVTLDADRIAAARGSLVEGYVSGIRDAERTAVVRSWDYPACTVPIGDGVVAVACGYPDDDAAEWAARLAGKLVKAKVKRAVLSGAEEVRTEVASALALVGIRVDGPEVEKPTGWLRLPWRR